MADVLRAGLVGLGAMGRNHARVLRGLPGVELVVVADPGGDPSGAAAGIPIVDKLDQALDFNLDICVVAAPTVTHSAAGLALAEAKVHTLIEKPLAISVEESAALADAFERSGVIGCVGHIERYNPAIRALRARLSNGELGEIYQVTTRRIGPFPARIADVGVILDLATHDIDLTSWVTGQHYARLSAWTAHKSGRAHEDLVSVSGQLSDGTVANHLVNWLSPFKERCTVVTGAQGAYVADTLTADLTFHANGQFNSWDALAQFRGVAQGDRITYAMDKREPLQAELDAFRLAVLGGESDIVTMREAAHVVSVAQAMITSAGSGDSVTIAAA